VYVLGLETSTDVCAAALCRGGSIVAEIRYKQAQIHAESIAGMVESIMTNSKVHYADLQGIAVAVGPGSFTGLRVGMALAKGLAWANNLGIIGISTPDAMAEAVLPNDEELAIVIPSRKGEIYAAHYQPGNDCHVRQGQVYAVRIDDFKQRAEGIGRISGPATEILRDAYPTEFKYLDEPYREVSAAAVARLGAQKILQDEISDPAKIELDYVKPFYSNVRIAG